MSIKVSIIIPVYNQLFYTKQCIESIKKNTKNISYEIIVIDNASDDGTDMFLKKNGIVFIKNNKNVGVAKAWNQGIKHAKGEYVCIINNDIIVSENWLYNLIKFYETIKNPGIVSPATREGELNYNFDEYSKNFVFKMKNIKEQGFFGWCMLIKKDLFSEIGLFNEDFNIGIGEDTDFYYRLTHFNKKSYITGSTFIHHFGSKTLSQIKEKNGNQFEIENIKKLKEKWKISDNYFIRKLLNFKKFIRNSFLKIFFGHTLIEK